MSRKKPIFVINDNETTIEDLPHNNKELAGERNREKLALAIEDNENTIEGGRGAAPAG